MSDEPYALGTADKLIPLVHWNEYEVSSEPHADSGGEVYLSLYSSDSDSTEDDPIAILVLSATETLDLINALAGELPFLTPNEGD